MYSFYAFMFRMKYINRWGLMKNTCKENIAEHSQHTAMVAHALAIIEKRVYGREVDENKVGMIALFHETGEVLTGDLPTPVKYFSPDIERAYKSVEAKAERCLINTLPNEIRGDLEQLVSCDKASYEYALVKCADKLCAYIKCIEEIKGLNGEFKSAYKSIKKSLDKLSAQIPSLSYFMEHFIPSYYKTLDDL